MPSSRKRKSRKRVSRSARLRKYESAYESCLKKTLVSCKKKTKRATPVKKSRARRNPGKARESSSGRKQENRTSSGKKVKKRLTGSSKNKRKSPKKSKDRKRPLNAYQRFVREESKKSKYKGMDARERMSAISVEWKKKKKRS
jgi:hypothetical protein